MQIKLLTELHTAYSLTQIFLLSKTGTLTSVCAALCSCMQTTYSSLLQNTSSMLTLSVIINHLAFHSLRISMYFVMYFFLSLEQNITSWQCDIDSMWTMCESWWTTKLRDNFPKEEKFQSEPFCFVVDVIAHILVLYMQKPLFCNRFQYFLL